MLVKAHTIFQDLAEVREEFDRFFARGANQSINGYYPPTNISENDDAYTVEARVPGLATADISLELEGRVLTIRGENKRVEAVYNREERATGKFARSFTFKHPLKADTIDANVKDGILTIQLPKAEESKPRKIAIVAK